MRFYVVDAASSRSREISIESEDFASVTSIRSMMWMPFPQSLDPMQLDTFISSTPSSVLQSDAVVVGVHRKAAERILNSADVLDVVARRIRGAPLLFVHLENTRPVITHVRGDRVTELESDLVVDRICQLDVADVVRRPGAELPKHPGLHYEGPNRDHYEAFLRPGFAVRSTDELDRIAFWLAPLLVGRRSIVVDHWSMIPIAYHVGVYLTDLNDVGVTRVASLGHYDEDADVLRQRLRSVFEPIEPQSGAVLVSVDSSGHLARDKLLPIMEELGFQKPVGVALTRSPGSFEDGFRSLTTLGDEFRRYEPKNCCVCTRQNATVIPIQQDSYLLSLAAYTQRTEIRRDDTRASTGVVEKYRDIGAFRVHRTHTDDRHHAYFVDLEPILDQKAFASRLDQKVRRFHGRNIDLVLHPGHSAARRLAAMVAARLGSVKIVESDESKLWRLSSEEASLVVRARRICLVDDVVISGARVYGYRRAIDAIRRSVGVSSCELYCVVGIARTATEKALKGIRDVLHHSLKEPRFLWVERLLLPQWDEDSCRWCEELRLLTGLPSRIRDRSLIQKRLATLSDRRGLVDDLFIPWRDANRPEWRSEEETWSDEEPDFASRFWELGPKSVFGEVQRADLATSVAAAIQGKRGERELKRGVWSESELDEEFRSPIAKVLDPRLYLAGRYYEPVIVASILRGSKKHDIRAPGKDAELLDRLAVLVGSESSTGLHGELMLAAAVGQLPRTGYNLSKGHADVEAVARELLGWERESG